MCSQKGGGGSHSYKGGCQILFCVFSANKYSYPSIHQKVNELLEALYLLKKEKEKEHTSFYTFFIDSAAEDIPHLCTGVSN